MAIDTSIKDAERYVYIELADSEMSVSAIETSFHENGGYLRGLDYSKVQGAEDVKKIEWEDFDSDVEIVSGQAPKINLEVIKTKRYVSLSFRSENPVQMTSLESAFACDEYLVDDVDLSVFSEVKSLKNTFAGTENFTGISSGTFDENSPTVIDGAFDGCTSLVNIPFDSMSIVQTAENAFRDCDSLTSFDFTKFESLLTMDGIIANTNISEIDISTLNTVENADGAFDGCTITGFVSGNESQAVADEIIATKDTITKIKVKGYEHSKQLYVSSGKYVFENLDDVHIQDNTVVRIENLFYSPTKMKFFGCSNLKEVAPLVIDSVTDATDMFREIQTLNIIPWSDMVNIEIADRMFNGTNFILAGDDPLGINYLKEVTSANYMFANSQSLSKIVIGTESEAIANAIATQIPNVPTYLDILSVGALNNYKNSSGTFLLTGVSSATIEDSQVIELDIRPYFKFLINFKDCSSLYSLHASASQIHNDMFTNCDAMRKLHIYDTNDIPTDAMNVHGDATFYDDVYIKGTLYAEGGGGGGSALVPSITQAEYDALSEAEKTNGQIREITDAEGEPVPFAVMNDELTTTSNVLSAQETENRINSLKTYIKNQNVLSDYESFQITTTDTEVQFDGVINFSSWTNSSKQDYYVNDVIVGKSNTTGSQNPGPLTLLVNKGDRVKYSGGLEAPDSVYARWYKLRDYTNR